MKSDLCLATSSYFSYVSYPSYELWPVEPLVPVLQFITQCHTSIHLNSEESNKAGQEIDKHSKFVKGNNEGRKPLVYVSESPGAAVSATELAQIMMCNRKTHYYY